MSKETYYFSHDYNAANDIKILFMRQQLGMEGYGIFWYLVEALANAGGRLPIAITPVLAMQIQVTEIKVRAVIEQFGLFIVENDEFFSQRLNRHLEIRKKLSDKGKEGAKRRWINGVPNGEAITVPNGEPYAKERKGKESKLNNSVRTFTRPTRSQLCEYMEEIGKVNESLADRFLNYYDSNGWKVGRSSMKDWKAAIRNWLKDEKQTKLDNEPVKIKIK